MKIVLKVLFIGAVVIIMTAPFLFSQSSLNNTFTYTHKYNLEGDSDFQQVFNLKLNNKPQSVLYQIRKPAVHFQIHGTIDTLKADTVKPKTVKKFRMKKSPTKAVLFSAVIPGAGQFYNESYWKIPVIAGLVGYFGYEYFRNNNLYKDNRDLYFNSQTPENPDGDQNLKTLREFYRDQRDDFVWYFLIVYVVNMLDAYVDAHLFDFDVSEEKLTRFNEPDKIYRFKFNLKF